MTTWDVVSSKARKTSPRGRLLRAGILVATCAVILSSGMVLTLQEPAPPPAPTFSEQALAEAYADTERLRSTGTVLAIEASAEATGSAQLDRTVTLLTAQGQALYRPVPGATDQPVSGPASSATPTPAPTSAPASIPAFLAELVASAGERLSDAQTADGGTARLLVAAGAGQLLEAGSLAAESGVPLPGPMVPEPGQTPGTPMDAAGATPTAVPSTIPTAAPTSGTTAAPSAQCPPSASSGLPAALTAVLESERQGDYGYQVALPRLSGDAAVLAADAWSRHQDLAEEAASLLAAYCLEVPPEAPGYALGGEFLATPADGLGALEAGALTVYGDLVAFSDGPTREWAVQALLETAQRAVRWGSDAGALPGLAVDASALPPLPDGAAPTGRITTSSPLQ